MEHVLLCFVILGIWTLRTAIVPVEDILYIAFNIQSRFTLGKDIQLLDCAKSLFLSLRCSSHSHLCPDAAEY